MSYQLQLPQFEGPFDLLLFFIERDELDIHDIPISKITDDFLAYLRQIEEMNLDVASEFILVAATLMRIKAKMLLPRRELDEAGNEIDPRQDLVDRLLEYKRYKEILAELQQMEEVRSHQFRRGNLREELAAIAGSADGDSELDNLTLYKLFNAFDSVMQRLASRKKAEHKVVRYPHSVKEEKARLIGMLQTREEVSFGDMFTEVSSRIHAVFLFLAMLELVQLHKLGIRIGDGMNNFWIQRGALYQEAEEPESAN